MLNLLARFWGFFWALQVVGSAIGRVTIARFFRALPSQFNIVDTKKKADPKESSSKIPQQFIDLLIQENLLTENMVTNFTDLIEDIKGPPRVVAIALGSLLENSLAIAIQRRMVVLDNETKARIFDSKGPCFDMSSKIDIGYSLGLYDKQSRNDLIIISRVRNRFAHKLTVRSFENREISSLLNKLISPKIYAIVVKMDKISDGRMNFIMAVFCMWVLLFIDMKSDDNRPKPARFMADLVEEYEKQNFATSQ